MIESFAPVLAPKNHSFCSRLLHSIVPGECYSNDDTFSRLHDAMAIDLEALFHTGVEAGAMELCKAMSWYVMFCRSLFYIACWEGSIGQWGCNDNILHLCGDEGGLASPKYSSQYCDDLLEMLHETCMHM